MQKHLISNFESLTEDDLNKFSGQWVAVVNGRIIVNKPSFKEVHELIKKKNPKQRVLFGKIPDSVPVVLSIN